jgi:primosomal replication protein N
LNRVQLSATLASISELRYTPAGVAVAEASLAHQGEVVEAGEARQLDFELDAVALGEVAARLARTGLGSRLGITGFLAPRSKRTRRWVIHINDFVQE